MTFFPQKLPKAKRAAVVTALKNGVQLKEIKLTTGVSDGAIRKIAEAEKLPLVRRQYKDRTRNDEAHAPGAVNFHRGRWKNEGREW